METESQESGFTKIVSDDRNMEDSDIRVDEMECSVGKENVIEDKTVEKRHSTGSSPVKRKNVFAVQRSKEDDKKFSLNTNSVTEVKSRSVGFLFFFTSLSYLILLHHFNSNHSSPWRALYVILKKQFDIYNQEEITKKQILFWIHIFLLLYFASSEMYFLKKPFEHVAWSDETHKSIIRHNCWIENNSKLFTNHYFQSYRFFLASKPRQETSFFKELKKEHSPEISSDVVYECDNEADDTAEGCDDKPVDVDVLKSDESDQVKVEPGQCLIVLVWFIYFINFLGLYDLLICFNVPQSCCQNFGLNIWNFTYISCVKIWKNC